MPWRAGVTSSSAEDSIEYSTVCLISLLSVCNGLFFRVVTLFKGDPRTPPPPNYNTIRNGKIPWILPVLLL